MTPKFDERQDGARSPSSRGVFGSLPPPDRFQKAGDTVRCMLSECEECMGGGLLDEASGLAAAALQMARRHGRDDLASDAAVRFVVLNIAMGREGEVERAVSAGWISPEDVMYISGLFEEYDAVQARELSSGRNKPIAELKAEILALIEELKAGSGSS